MWVESFFSFEQWQISPVIIFLCLLQWEFEREAGGEVQCDGLNVCHGIEVCPCTFYYLKIPSPL